VSLLRIGDISQNGELVSSNFLRIAPQESINNELFLRRGDVLFPNRGTRTTALAYTLDVPGVVPGAQLFLLRPMQEKVWPKYLAWNLRSERAANYFAQRRKGTHVQVLQVKDVAEFQIPLPPLAAQQKIAEAADLALQERELLEQLARQKWKFTNQQLFEAAIRWGKAN
jgi:type I restriction enzyme S subunit